MLGRPARSRRAPRTGPGQSCCRATSLCRIASSSSSEASAMPASTSACCRSGPCMRESSRTRRTVSRFGQTSPMPPMPKKTPPRLEVRPEPQPPHRPRRRRRRRRRDRDRRPRCSAGATTASTRAPPRTSTGSHRTRAVLGDARRHRDADPVRGHPVPGLPGVHRGGPGRMSSSSTSSPARSRCASPVWRSSAPTRRRRCATRSRRASRASSGSTRSSSTRTRGPRTPVGSRDDLLEQIATALDLDWDAAQGGAPRASRRDPADHRDEHRGGAAAGSGDADVLHPGRRRRGRIRCSRRVLGRGLPTDPRRRPRPARTDARTQL